MGLHSLFCGSCQMSPSLPFGFPCPGPGGFVAGSTTGYLSRSPCCLPALGQVLLKLSLPRPQPFLPAELAMAVRGAAHDRGTEELALRSVSLQLQNLTQTHWCAQGRENWQAVWSCVKYGSSLCRSVLCVFRAPHTVQEM